MAERTAAPPNMLDTQTDLRCPSCGGAFQCGAKSVPFACGCQNLHLTPDETATLRERFGSQCLCRACLQKMQTKRKTL